LRPTNTTTRRSIQALRLKVPACISVQR